MALIDLIENCLHGAELVFGPCLVGANLVGVRVPNAATKQPFVGLAVLTREQPGRAFLLQSRRGGTIDCGSAADPEEQAVALPVNLGMPSDCDLGQRLALESGAGSPAAEGASLQAADLAAGWCFASALLVLWSVTAWHSFPAESKSPGCQTLPR